MAAVISVGEDVVGWLDADGTVHAIEKGSAVGTGRSGGGKRYDVHLGHKDAEGAAVMEACEARRVFNVALADGRHLYLFE